MAETSTELGGALGIAILGSIGAAMYRNQVANTFSAGVPANAAVDTLGGAMATAGQCSSPFSSMVLGVAREAFTSGVHAVAGLSAAVVAVLAFLVIVLLRGVPSDGEASSTP